MSKEEPQHIEDLKQVGLAMIAGGLAHETAEDNPTVRRLQETLGKDWIEISLNALSSNDQRTE